MRVREVDLLSCLVKEDSWTLASKNGNKATAAKEQKRKLEL